MTFKTKSFIWKPFTQIFFWKICFLIILISVCNVEALTEFVRTLPEQEKSVRWFKDNTLKCNMKPLGSQTCLLDLDLDSTGTLWSRECWDEGKESSLNLPLCLLVTALLYQETGPLLPTCPAPTGRMGSEPATLADRHMPFRTQLGFQRRMATETFFITFSLSYRITFSLSYRSQFSNLSDWDSKRGKDSGKRKGKKKEKWLRKIRDIKGCGYG